MNITKTALLTVSVIVIWGISIMIIQLLIKKEKTAVAKESGIQRSYSVLFASLIAAVSMVNFKVLSALNEVIDITIVLKRKPYTVALPDMILITGVSICWFILCYAFAYVLLLMVSGKRSVVKEIESDHWQFFLLRGILFIGFLYSVMPILELLLRNFYPVVESPFFH